MTTKSQRQRIIQESKFRCGYCLLQEMVSGIPLTLEHIIPKARGGSDEDDNLWSTCRICNERKGILVEVVDPDTGEIVLLFNPRRQDWNTHFSWTENGRRIYGKTAVGRATVEALALNDELRVRSRAIWVKAGWHPPD